MVGEQREISDQKHITSPIYIIWFALYKCNKLQASLPLVCGTGLATCRHLIFRTKTLCHRTDHPIAILTGKGSARLDPYVYPDTTERHFYSIPMGERWLGIKSGISVNTCRKGDATPPRQPAPEVKLPRFCSEQLAYLSIEFSHPLQLW